MLISRRLFTPLQHCEDAALRICQILNLRVTQSSIRKDLLEHPDYPSLASIMDVFKNYGVENDAYKLRTDHFDQLPTPFVAHINAEKLRHELFAPVLRVNKDYLEIYNPETRKKEIWPIERFQKVYKGTVLALEPNEHSGEKEYAKNLKEEKRRLAIHNIIVVIPFILTAISCAASLFSAAAASTIAPIVFTTLTFAGSIVCTLLLWYEIDEHNPALKQICQAGKKVNCSSILGSKASKIFGISWGSIGAVYFMGILLALLTNGITNPAILQLAAWINILALPYIFFSIYYQWKVAKQWCILCLLVQGILFLQFFTALVGGFPLLIEMQALTPQSYLTFLSCFGVIFIMILLLIPAMEKAKQARQKTIELQRLKHNPQIFNALLYKQRTIERSTEGLGIILGNPQAKYRLVKVCNPYCGPCAAAHPVMEELLQNNEDVQVQIIFTATDDENDYRAPVIKHLLAIANKQDEPTTKKALDDWYLSADKNYAAFAAKYPDTPALEEQRNSIKAMREWCDAIGISFTPTFFLNERELPNIYSVTDLKYFFKG